MLQTSNRAWARMHVGIAMQCMGMIAELKLWVPEPAYYILPFFWCYISLPATVPSIFWQTTVWQNSAWWLVIDGDTQTHKPTNLAFLQSKWMTGHSRCCSVQSLHSMNIISSTQFGCIKSIAFCVLSTTTQHSVVHNMLVWRFGGSQRDWHKP